VSNPVDSVELSTIYLFLEIAVLLVRALIINLTRTSEAGIKEEGIGECLIGEGGFEGIILCFFVI
jgi:hypothetical protein